MDGSGQGCKSVSEALERRFPVCVLLWRYLAVCELLALLGPFLEGEGELRGVLGIRIKLEPHAVPGGL